MAQRSFPAAPPNPSTPLVPVPSSASPSILSRTQKFIEDNQKLLILGAAVAVSAGAGYYLYNRTSDGKPGSSGSSSSSSTGAAAGAKKSKKNKKKKSNGDKGLKGEGLEGPLLEEIEPKQAAPAATAGKSEGPDHLKGVPDAAGLAAMSEADRNKLGATLKDRGNSLYSKKDYKTAAECYTKAIEVSVKRDAVFYSNRAACYGNHSPPEYEKVVADCDEALKLDKTYAKALKRRANAYELLGKYEEAMHDFVALSILEQFKDDVAAESMERCLKSVATTKAKEQFEKREPKMPGNSFVAQYLGAFRPHPKPALPENPTQGDQTLSLAFDAIAAADYTHANQFCNEAIEQGISWKEGQAEAYAMRGTFKFLIGDSEGAKDDLEKALDIWPEFTQAWVKIASVHMELDDKAGAFGDFEAAIRHNPNDPDIYYHRGQVYFIMQEFDQALADYEKSTQLDGDFIFSHIQHAVALYKKGNVAPSMAAFRRILKQFPDRPEPSTYYGELMLDQQKFAEAVDRFDKAIELDADRRPRNPLPIVNKALVMVQWKQDSAEAEKLLMQALDLDPDCDTAIITMAQLTLQRGDPEGAIKWFERSGKLARTQGELENALTFEHASRAQVAFSKKYPEYAHNVLAAMAQSM